MNTFQNKFKFLVVLLACLAMTMPVFALDLDSTVNDSQRQTYDRTKEQTQTSTQQTNRAKTESEVQKNNAEGNVIPAVNTIQKTEEKPVIKQDLPSVPALPSKANSSTVAPINNQYSGKVPNKDAIIPCGDIKVGDLIIDDSVVKSKTEKTAKTKTTTTAAASRTKVTENYRYVTLAKGTQIRATNKTKITDLLAEGGNVIFLTTQEIYTPVLKIPKNTKLTARVVSAHRPQMSCNGGLVGLRLVSAEINGKTQTIDGGVFKLQTDRIYFSNLKGEHTYMKTVAKKAKWGQNMFSKWSKTSKKLANNGAGVVLAPFPYIGGCVLAGASTISSPVTALLGKGGNLVIPANTVFTLKLYDEAKIRY